MLLHLAGEEVQDIFETLGNLQENNYAQVKDKLSDYFKPQKNIAYERHAFRSCKQEKNEKMDDYIIRLKKLAISCDYAEETVSDMIRDQIVDSCQSNELREKILKEKDLTLKKINKKYQEHQILQICTALKWLKKKEALHRKRNMRTKSTRSQKGSSIIRVLSPNQQGSQN